MGTSRDRLIEFMKRKNEIIKQHTRSGIALTTAEDLHELSTWPEEECTEALSKLGIEPGDTGCCPWCISDIVESCHSCGYGKRNGVCNHYRSRYRWATPLDTAISELPDIQELVSEFSTK